MLAIDIIAIVVDAAEWIVHVFGYTVQLVSGGENNIQNSLCTILQHYSNIVLFHVSSIHCILHWVRDHIKPEHIFL